MLSLMRATKVRPRERMPRPTCACTSPCARVTAQLKEDHPVEVLIDELERVKAGIRAKVEALHGDQAPVRPCKDALPWPQKTQPQLFTLLALSNLWMERSKLLGEQG